MIWIEAVAVLFGLLAVWLTVRQDIWCWPAGLVQVALYVVIFASVKLYSDLILHIIYIFLQFYGWYWWLHGGKNRDVPGVSRLTASSLRVWILGTVAGTVIWGYSMATLTDAAVPYADGFTTVASLGAMWLMARKRLESWQFWIAVDVVAIGVYFYKALYLTTGLYFMFLLLSISGWRRWKATLLVSREGDLVDNDGTHARQVRPFS